MTTTHQLSLLKLSSTNATDPSVAPWPTPSHDKPADVPHSDIWRSLVSGHIETHEIACAHNTMTQPASLAKIGQVLAKHLDIINNNH
ncbi:MAG: hypothetical protein ACRDQ4_08580 [Pseudonocardiaceae bacterium]